MISFRIFPKILLAAIVLISSCSASPEIFQGSDKAWTTNDITQNRDIARYEQGGHFWCHTKPFGNEENSANSEKKVRDFLWEHWTERKRGYIKFSCAGGADASDTVHYFIEPNEKGEWNIVRRQISQLNEKFFRKDDVLNSVEHVENKNSDDWTLISKTTNGEIQLQLPF